MLQQPLGGARIKVLQAFPMEGVAGIVIQMQLCAWDQAGHFFAHPLRRESVIFAADDEGWAGHARQLLDRVVIHGGGGLGFHGMDWLRGWIDGGLGSSCQDTLPAVIVVKPRFGEDQHLDVMHEVFWTKSGFALHEVLPSGQPKPVLPGPGAHQDHARHLVRVADGQLLGNHGAERAANNAGAGDVEGIHQRGIIIRHHFSGVGTSGFVSATHASVVPKDAPKMRLPSGGMSVPDDSGCSDPHNANQRFARAALGVGHFDSGGQFQSGHGGRMLGVMG